MSATATVRLDAKREEQELRDYLGERFEVERLWRYQEQLDAEFRQTDDEAAFYRTSNAYLYNLTAFAMTGTKLRYLQELTRRLAPGARVLDYGCGIGSDGLMLLEAGYRVEFADFENPSIEYLRWRLDRRGVTASIHNLDAGVPDGFAGAYAFDVIEHVEDPFEFLRAMEERADIVAVNFLEPEPDDQDAHHELPIRDLVAYAGAHPLLFYRVLHERSHFVIYESREASPGTRALSHLKMMRGRLRGTR